MALDNLELPDLQVQLALLDQMDKLVNRVSLGHLEFKVSSWNYSNTLRFALNIHAQYMFLKCQFYHR